jgi:hypothetical protein
MDELELKFKEHFDRLPEVVQEYVLHGNYSSEIASIGHLFKFHIDTMGQLSDFVTYVLVGIIPTHEAEKKFTEFLPEYSAQTKAILQEIERRILSSVRTMTTIKSDSTAPIEQVTAPSAISNLPTTPAQQAQTVPINTAQVPVAVSPQKLPMVTPATPPTSQTAPNQNASTPMKTVGKEIVIPDTAPKKSTDPYREPVD